MLIRIWLLILWFVIGGCQVQIKDRILLFSPSLFSHAPFAFVPKETILPKDARYIGQLRSYAFFAPLDCDYESIINKMEQAGRKNGANLGVIVQDKKMNNPPDCHEIKVNLYLLNDISPFESGIVWSPARKLSKQDFKGVKEMRSSQSSAYFSTPYHSRYLLRGISLSAKATFDCRLSYWVDSVSGLKEQSELQFFQFLFDIQEVYKRHFLSQLDLSLKHKHSVTQKIDSIYRSNHSACELKKDAFQLSVKAERKISQEWYRWRGWMLDSLKTYETGEVKINLKP